MPQKEEFIQSIKDGKAYDYIANNYHNMSKEMLKDILLEYIYALTSDRVFPNYSDDRIIEELKERWDD